MKACLELGSEDANKSPEFKLHAEQWVVIYIFPPF